MRFKLLILLVLLQFVSKFSLGQEMLKLTGWIKDCSTNQLLSGAVIELTGNTKEGQTFVKTTVSDSTKVPGNFKFEIPQGSIISVKVSLLGYETYTTENDPKSIWSLNTGIRSLGNICMVHLTKELQEVTVVGKKELIELKHDRTVYNVKQDPQAVANNLTTLLSRLPFFTINSEGKLLYKNSPGIVVYIDGKPSNIAKYNPESFLMMIQGRTVDHVDIITSPSAKYDMNGNGIVLDLITLKTENGYSVNINASSDSFGSLGGGANVIVKNGQWGVNAMSTINNNVGANTYSQSNYYDYLNQMIRHVIDKTGKVNNFNTLNRVGVSYDLNKQNLFNIGFGLNNRKGDNQTGTLSTVNEFSLSNELVQSYNNPIRFRNTNNRLFIDADYLYTFKPDTARKSMASLSIAYNFNDNEGANFNDNLVLGTTFNVNGKHNETNNKYVEHTFQSDYTLTNRGKKNYIIEAGLKAIVRNNNENSFFLWQLPQMELFDVIKQNFTNFEYKQQVYSGYVSFNKKFKKWGVTLGTRAEYNTNIGIVNETNSFNNSFAYLMPSLNISYLPSRANRFTFFYKTTVQKPTASALNPAIIEMNTRRISFGNPDIKPERQHSLRFDYNYMNNNGLSVSSGLDFRFSNNAFEYFSWMDKDSIQKQTVYNSAVSKFLLLSFSVQQSLLDQKLRLKFWAMPMKRWLNNKFSATKEQSLSSDFSVGGTYTFTEGPSIDCDLNYRGSMYFVQSKTEGFFTHRITVSQSLLNKNLGLSMSVDSPFKKQRENENHRYGINFDSYSNSVTPQRVISLRANYRFGKMKSQQRTNNKKIINDDTKGVN